MRLRRRARESGVAASKMSGSGPGSPGQGRAQLGSTQKRAQRWKRTHGEPRSVPVVASRPLSSSSACKAVEREQERRDRQTGHAGPTAPDLARRFSRHFSSCLFRRFFARAPHCASFGDSGCARPSSNTLSARPRIPPAPLALIAGRMERPRRAIVAHRGPTALDGLQLEAQALKLGARSSVRSGGCAVGGEAGVGDVCLDDPGARKSTSRSGRCARQTWRRALISRAQTFTSRGS